MRDPKRIPKICARLAAVWEHVPDWRLGQLLMNLLNMYVEKTKRDPFFPEDEELISFFESLFDGKDGGANERQ